MLWSLPPEAPRRKEWTSKWIVTTYALLSGDRVRLVASRGAAPWRDCSKRLPLILPGKSSNRPKPYSRLGEHRRCSHPDEWVVGQFEFRRRVIFIFQLVILRAVSERALSGPHSRPLLAGMGRAREQARRTLCFVEISARSLRAARPLATTPSRETARAGDPDRRRGLAHALREDVVN
jgi:hypothetical protein